MSQAAYKPTQKSRYRKIEVRMWGDEKFRALSPMPPSGQALWVFLLTGPHTGPIPGLFRSGRAAMAEELDWEPEAFGEAFREVLTQGMAKADWKAKVVWIPNAILCNRPESPNVVTSWGSEWDLIPECDLKREAYEVLRASIHALGEGFAKAFDKAFYKPSAKPSPKPSFKTIANQEQEQEQEQKNIKDLSVSTDRSESGSDLTLLPTEPPEVKKNPVEEIFAYWQKRMDSPRSKLDDKRCKVIKAALKMGYSPADLCRAIRGCSLTPHNMGQNDRSQKYNGIELIFRSADQIDRFIANGAAPPSASSAVAHQQADEDARRAENDEAKRLLFGKRTEAEGEVIDV